MTLDVLHMLFIVKRDAENSQRLHHSTAASPKVFDQGPFVDCKRLENSLKDELLMVHSRDWEVFCFFKLIKSVVLFSGSPLYLFKCYEFLSHISIHLYIIVNIPQMYTN